MIVHLFHYMCHSSKKIIKESEGLDDIFLLDITRKHYARSMGRNN